MIRKLGLVLAMWVMGWATSVHAADWKNAPPKSHAVIIGVGEFKDAKVKARPSIEADAQALYDLFTNPKIGAIPRQNVKLFLGSPDAARNATLGTKKAILDGLKETVAQSAEQELIYVILVAQGGSQGQQGIIFAQDSTVAERTKTGILAEELEASLKGAKAQVCTMFDVNFKGFEVSDKETALNPQLKDFTDAFLGTKGQDEESPLKDGRVMIFSGRTITEPLVVDGKNGIFTKVTIDALAGAADKDGYEADGIVTLDEFTKYIEKEIPALARKTGKEGKDQIQFPGVIAGVETHFVMTYNPTVREGVVKNLEAWKKLAKEKNLAEDILKEGEKFLSRMPKLKALQELRKGYISVVSGSKKPEDFLAERVKIYDGMKLPREDAMKYAQLLMDGSSRVQKMFIKEVSMSEMIAHGIRGLYQRSEEKLPEELNTKLKGLSALRRAEVLDIIADAREPLGKREDLDSNKDAEISFFEMCRKLGDNYTTYFDKDKVEEVEKQTQGSFSGIGVVIRADLNKDALRVVSPIRGSPAYKAGLRTGDLILEIRRDVDREGKKLEKTEVISTKGMDTVDAVKIITGKEGTNVTLKIEREGEKEPISVEITRGIVEVESVLGWKRKDDDSWDYYIDPKNKIAYIYLSQFSRKSDKDMERVIQKLEADKVNGVVLDLRFNPGGYLDVVHRMADMFIDDGTIVSIRPRVGPGEVKRGASKGSFLRFPMVCLINGESASASEILSAALQDHNRAVVMGERSFGKGSVQTIAPYTPTGGEFKVTIATFWRPSGRNLNKSSTKGTPDEDWGVRPDSAYELKLDAQEKSDLRERLVNDWSVIPRRDGKDIKAQEEQAKKAAFKDRQLEMALEYLRLQIKASNESEPFKKAG